MGYRVVHLYFETTVGFLSLYILQHAYTNDENIVCKYKAEIMQSDSGRESHCLYSGSWRNTIIDSLTEGIENAYNRGALKLLFTKCLESNEQVASMFNEK